jgi:hypothetical protein
LCRIWRFWFQPFGSSFEKPDVRGLSQQSQSYNIYEKIIIDDTITTTYPDIGSKKQEY